MTTERLTVDRLSKRAFWKLIIISFCSAWTLVMIALFLLQDFSVFEYNRSSHKLFILITLRDWESITNIFSNTRLTYLQTSLIYRKRHVIILYSLCKVRSFVFTSSSSISSIHMIRIDIQNCCEIINRSLNLALLFISTTSDIISASVPRIDISFLLSGRSCNQFHQRVTILNSLIQIAVLEIVTCSQKECLFMCGVRL